MALSEEPSLVSYTAWNSLMQLIVTIVAVYMEGAA